MTFGDAALFAAITHDLTPNFYFVFYSERLDSMWILSSEEFLQECVTNKTGKNAGKHSIWFNRRRTDRKTGEKTEYCLNGSINIAVLIFQDSIKEGSEIMVCIDEKKGIDPRIAESMGFDRYKQIMEMVRKTDVSTDLDFQRTVNTFYRVRRNDEWWNAYYDLLEKVKGSSPQSSGLCIRSLGISKHRFPVKCW